jgi:DNA-binding Lrp family transcriptional regulator
MNMDELDTLILIELIKDPQESFLGIAKRLGTSPYTIGKRYEKMKKEGIIYKSVISIDLSKLGYQGKAFLMITNAPNQEKKKTIEALSKIKNIISVTEIIGAFDVLAIAPVTDLNSIMTLVKEIKELPGVMNVEMTLIKDTAFPLNANFGKIMSKKYLEPRRDSQG